MKIALIGLRLAVANRLLVDTFSPAFMRKGHEVIFCGDVHYDPPPWLHAAAAVSDGASYRAMARDFVRPSMYRRVIRFLQAERPDICYFISVHPAAAVLGTLIRRLVRTNDGRPPVVAMHIHDPVPHPGLTALPIGITHHLQARTADKLVVYGDELKRLLARNYRVHPDRIVVIPHGTYRDPRTEPPPPRPARWFSCLGRIEPYKGIEVFLEAAERVRAVHPDVRFYLAGAGTMAPYRAAVARLGDGVIVDNQEITNDETDRVMRDSWAVVLSYTSGTQSGVIPIAYWNGVPVIVSEVGALPEMVQQDVTGFLVPPGDVDELVRRMMSLIDRDDTRVQMGRCGFRLYHERYRWDTIVDQLLSGLSR